MNLISRLWKKIYDKFQYEIRFVIVGVINTIVGVGSYALFVKLGMYYLLANVFSTIIGTANSYLWNKFFTFRSHKKSLMEVVRFVTVYVVSFFISTGTLKLLVDVIGMDSILASIPNLVIQTAVSYLGHRFFSFRGSVKRAETEK